MVHSVQHDDHARSRSRSQGKSTGPVFTIPALPCANVGVVSPSTVSSVTTTASVGKFGQAGPAMSSAAAQGAVDGTQLGRFVGRATGSGQCVALAKAVQPSLGATSNWRGGERVQGNTGLPPGTVIATFNGANRYANALDGSSHAAVYLGQNAKGVQVLDQWAGSAASVRTIPWDNPSGVAANTGTAFKVVKTG